MATASAGFDRFHSGFSAGITQLVHRELVADTQTPVSAFLALADGQTNCFLLESVEGGEVRGRFSVIGLQPDLLWRCHDNRAEINRTPDRDDGFQQDSMPPLDSLRRVMAESQMDDTGDLPPMAAGLFGYFGYDMIRQIETIPDQNTAAIAMDDSLLLRPSLIAIFDRLKDSITLVTQIRPAEWDNADAAWQDAQHRLDKAIESLDRPLPHTEVGDATAKLCEPTTNMSKSAFLDMVKKAKD